jgi:crotonobetainyl-CoA:carnitine CoA-transferase CaiB-like acyl-CoA transferase
VYRCADSRFLAVGPLEPHLYRNLCAALGLPELASLNEASPPHALEQAREKLRARFLLRSRNDWFEKLKEADCCVAPVLELDEVFRDPHHLARGMRLEVEHEAFGPVPQIGIAAKLRETPGAVRTAGPPPGAHTAAVLEGLGFAAAEIGRLRRCGAVG